MHALVPCVITGLALTLSALPWQQPPKKPKPSPTRSAEPVQAAAPMMNADVIQMFSAGLSEAVIISAIERAERKQFDLTVQGLVALKKAGVSDALILFLQTGQRPPAHIEQLARVAGNGDGTKAAPAPSDDVPSNVRAEDGVYYIAGDSIQRIEAKTPYQTRTGSTAVARLTFGIKKKRLNAMLPGLAADVAVGQAPRFYVHLAKNESIGEYYLIKFTVKQQFGRRELEVGSAGLGKAQAGFAEKDIFLIDAKRLDKDMYIVTPKVGLSAGEYSLLVVPQATGSGQTGLTPRKIFDFSVR